MPKFRKKPVVIEAFQMSKLNSMNMDSWPEWLSEAYGKSPDEGGSVFRSCGSDSAESVMYINTLEGHMMVSEDDYIIKGVKGELYPCKPDIFESTYESM